MGRPPNVKAVQSGPIAENEHVKEFLAIMKKNKVSTSADLLAVIGQIGAMERQLASAVDELAAMRRELAEAQTQNHPVKSAMQKAVIVMQSHVLKLRDKLSDLKQSIIDGCKNAVAEFKEKGISALNNTARFFKVRPILEAMQNELAESIQLDDKAIAKIEAISTEYHEAGQHLKNIGRAITGKEVMQEAKPVGKIAKTFSAPFRVERKCLSAMKKSVGKAINALSCLEERAAENKPSIKETIQTFNEKIAQDKESISAPERPRTVKAER